MQQKQRRGELAEVALVPRAEFEDALEAVGTAIVLAAVDMLGLSLGRWLL